MTIAALTAYGVPIPRAFADRKAALAQAETLAETFPGCRIVRLTAAGPRTIWKHEPETQEKAA
jgi:hypothetical protein